MGLSLTQRAQDAQPIGPPERLERLTGFTARQLAAGMTWLAGYDPRTFDAVLDAVEPGPGLDDSDDPEPFCATCGIPIGIFLEVFDPGHEPAVAWRLTGDAAIRL